MLELLLAVLLFTASVRYAGDQGVRRFKALSEKRAQAVHESFASRTVDWLVLLTIAAAAVNAGLAGFLGSWLGVAISVVALALCLGARAMRPAARSNVNAGFAERGLEPLTRRETSARRDRRQKQFAVTAVIGYLSGRVLNVIAEHTGETWPQVVQLPATVLLFGGGLALLWSMAWRFGDERPA